MSNNHGGARTGSGAKKKQAKKPITLYIHVDEVERMGGREETRFILYSKWEEELGLPHGTLYNHTVKKR